MITKTSPYSLCFCSVILLNKIGFPFPGRQKFAWLLERNLVRLPPGVLSLSDSHSSLGPPSCWAPSLIKQPDFCSIGHVSRLARLSPVDSLLFTVCAVSVGAAAADQRPGGRWIPVCVCVWSRFGGVVLGGGAGGSRGSGGVVAIGSWCQQGVWNGLLSREPRGTRSSGLWCSLVLRERQHEWGRGGSGGEEER